MIFKFFHLIELYMITEWGDDYNHICVGRNWREGVSEPIQWEGNVRLSPGTIPSAYIQYGDHILLIGGEENADPDYLSCDDIWIVNVKNPKTDWTQCPIRCPAKG